MRIAHAILLSRFWCGDSRMHSGINLMSSVLMRNRINVRDGVLMRSGINLMSGICMHNRINVWDSVLIHSGINLRSGVLMRNRINVRDCTDGNAVFRCDSDKNSLVIISML